MKPNQEVRKEMRVQDITLWQVAATLGVHEVTLSRWLRVQLTPEKRERVLAAIEAAAIKKAKGEVI